jgi:hypothetical protein
MPRAVERSIAPARKLIDGAVSAMANNDPSAASAFALIAIAELVAGVLEQMVDDD